LQGSVATHLRGGEMQCDNFFIAIKIALERNRMRFFIFLVLHVDTHRNDF